MNRYDPSAPRRQDYRLWLVVLLAGDLLAGLAYLLGADTLAAIAVFSIMATFIAAILVFGD